MTTLVKTMIKQTFTKSTHAAQTEYNSFCGDIEYLLSGTTEFITMDVAKLELTLLNTNGMHTKINDVNLTSRLKLYPTNFVNQSFKAEITSPCEVNTFKAGLLIK